jgi:hypothetical protein
VNPVESETSDGVSGEKTDEDEADSMHSDEESMSEASAYSGNNAGVTVHPEPRRNDACLAGILYTGIGVVILLAFASAITDLRPDKVITFNSPHTHDAHDAIQVFLVDRNIDEQFVTRKPHEVIVKRKISETNDIQTDFLCMGITDNDFNPDDLPTTSREVMRKDFYNDNLNCYIISFKRKHEIEFYPGGNNYKIFVDGEMEKQSSSINSETWAFVALGESVESVKFNRHEINAYIRNPDRKWIEHRDWIDYIRDRWSLLHVTLTFLTGIIILLISFPLHARFS